MRATSAWAVFFVHIVAAVGAEVAPLSEPEIFEFLHQHLPMVVEPLQVAKESDPERYETQLDLVRRRIEGIQAAREVSPEAAAALIRSHVLEFELHQVAQETAGQEVPPSEVQRARVRELLDDIFELRLQPSDEEVALLEQEIAAIKARLEERRAEKDAIIDRRLRMVLEDPLRPVPW